MNKISTLGVSELICTRMSHDLIGNVGAVANAVELLEEGDMDFIDDIQSILKNSSTVLSSRMKFFRMAFGSSNSNLDQLPLVHKTIEDYLHTIGNQTHQIDLEFSLIDSRFSKMAMIVSMILGDTFIRGGKVSIRQEDDMLIASSENNQIMKDKIFIIKEVIAGNIVENLAQYAPILYLKEILENSPYEITTTDDEALNIIIK